MNDLDLYERVSRKLRAQGVNLEEVSKSTGLSTKTLRRVAQKKHDAMFGTLVAIETHFRQSGNRRVKAAA